VNLAQALAQNQAVENELGKPKVHRYVVRVEIVQREHHRARKSPPVHRHWIGQMDNVHGKSLRHRRQPQVVPAIPAHGTASHLGEMCLETRMRLEVCLAYKSSLPRSRDKMYLRYLRAKQRASDDIKGMALHPGHLGRKCNGSH
jgi:hypothetical protein